MLLQSSFGETASAKGEKSRITDNFSMVTFVPGSSRSSRGAGTTSSRNSDHILVTYGAIVVAIVIILLLIDIIFSVFVQ